MDVILLERISRLGSVGDVVKVKNGFARNFLLPQKKALRATEDNKKVFEGKRAVLEKQNAETRAAAEKLAATMANLSVSIIRQAAEDGKLYGSVAARDVEVALAEAGHKVERRYIDLTTAIKSLGVYEAIVNLHPEVHVKVKVQVARNAEGLLAQELAAKADDKTDEAAMFDEAEDESAA
ncbi:MAG: 50S ribosomal protein L9 [Alphaproteobacteria bacterium]|nr:50S ribosomal protein L9 [Alphaproteobacteria bacterium]